MDQNIRHTIGPADTQGLFIPTGERRQHFSACELLNSMGQSLLLARIKVGMLSSPLLRDEFEALAGEVRSLLDRAASETNALSREICPPLLAEAGLTTALEWLARQMSTDCGLQVQFAAAGSEKPLGIMRGAVVYQMARELLINVVKHSGSGTARLNLDWGQELLRLEVEDRGAGFDPAVIENHGGKRGCFGLRTIRQAAQGLGGETTIVSVPGVRTLVAIRVPIPGGEER